jgi:hypothetical protein
VIRPDVHHHVEVRNTTDAPLDGFRLAFDNAPFKLDAPPIPPHGTYVFDFVRAAETGYVFSIPDGNDRLELGRCGYTTSGLNSYIVTISARDKSGFACDDVSPPHSGFP